MQEQIKNLIKNALDIKIEAKEVVLERPADLQMGDYSTNVAFILAKKLKTSPVELAEKIAGQLRSNLKNSPRSDLEKIEAVSGFVNFYLNKYFFQESVKKILDNKNFGRNHLFKSKKIMIEYTDPNPFKPFHIGHLMTNAIGESISRIVENGGAKVLRANYQGDAGLHIAKAIWGILKSEEYEKRKEFIDLGGDVAVAASWIGECYVKGAEAYENDNIKKEIDEINKKIYEGINGAGNEKINEIYDWGFKTTMEAFEGLYKILGTKFDLYFLESEVAALGEKLVRDNVGKVFEASDGAIVFKAEKYDPRLHTRVFITSGGLPTYETKELGLTEAKFETRADLDLSLVITANEQADYMRVVAKALSMIEPNGSEHEKKMKHITHGMMRFAAGKMSSRKGNVVTGESLIRDARAAILEKISDRDFSDQEREEVASGVGVAALKYSILKSSIGGDIIYDFEKSISFEGDSGPYLQYSYARARSILNKAEAEGVAPGFGNLPENVSELERLLCRFPEAAHRAGEEYAPHYIANFLIELSRSFNTYYGNTKIIDKNDPLSAYRVALTEAFSIVLRNGLHLLGIAAPERM